MKKVSLALLALACFSIGTVALAAGAAASTSMGGNGLGGVAFHVTTNIANIAKLITAASYVAGMAFVVAAIVKFKSHKENPTQIPIGTPIALLFVGAALIFVPSVFKVSGETLFGGGSGLQKSSDTGFTSF